MAHLIPPILALPLPLIDIFYDLKEKAKIGKRQSHTVEDLTQIVYAMKQRVMYAEIRLVVGGGAQALAFLVTCVILKWAIFPSIGLLLTLGFIGLGSGRSKSDHKELSQKKNNLYKKCASTVTQELRCIKEDNDFASFFIMLQNTRLEPESPEGQGSLATKESVETFRVAHPSRTSNVDSLIEKINQLQQNAECRIKGVRNGSSAPKGSKNFGLNQVLWDQIGEGPDKEGQDLLQRVLGCLSVFQTALLDYKRFAQKESENSNQISLQVESDSLESVLGRLHQSHKRLQGALEAAFKHEPQF